MSRKLLHIGTLKNRTKPWKTSHRGPPTEDALRQLGLTFSSAPTDHAVGQLGFDSSISTTDHAVRQPVFIGPNGQRPASRPVPVAPNKLGAWGCGLVNTTSTC